MAAMATTEPEQSRIGGSARGRRGSGELGARRGAEPIVQGRTGGRWATRLAGVLGVGLAVTAAACGGPKPPGAAGAPRPAPTGSAAADYGGTEALGAEGAPPAAEPKTYAVRLEEAEVAEALGPYAKKLKEIGKLSPKTHEALLKSYLWKPTAECEGLSLVEVEPSPGVLVAKGEALKLRAEVAAHLKEAGALAKQRGTAIEVLSGHEAVSAAVERWNQAAIDAALAAVKAASRGDKKEKNLMSAARKHLDAGADPRSWGAEPCASGRFGGLSVAVQLVALEAGGGRGAVLVKGGPEGDRFEKETYEATYWDKAKGKSFRLLTEIMSAGHFVRQCSEASRFIATTDEGTWRCKEGTESWEPPNRPLPAWQ